MCLSLSSALGKVKLLIMKKVDLSLLRAGSVTSFFLLLVLCCEGLWTVGLEVQACLGCSQFKILPHYPLVRKSSTLEWHPIIC